METKPYEMNQLGSDSHLPPRKRLLAGFKKLNGSSSSLSASASASSSTSNTNGSSSSSSSTELQTRLDNLLTSRFNNDQNQSPEELVEATRSAAALAVKAAKAARALANEKALISAKAIAAAKRALEFVDSFPKEAMESSPKKNKMKKHVPVEVLYSKRQIRDEEDDLDRAIDNNNNNKHPRISRTCSKMQKKNKTVDADEAEEEGNSFGKRRGRVKLKKLPLSICNSRYEENGSSSTSQLPVVQTSEDGVVPVVITSGSSSWKCQDLKAPECVKQNKAVRS